MCTPILIQDTYTIHLNWDINGALEADAIIDPASTIPYSIGPNGIKIDCCDPTQICEDVEYAIDYSFGDVSKIGSFYNTSQADYFTKSQYLTTVELTGNTIMTGAGLSFIKYNNYLTNTVALKNTLIGTFDFPLNICAQSIVGKSSQMTVEMGTTPYCKFFKTCDFSVERVPHSERFFNLSLFNPQMEQEPIFNNVLYFIENANNNTSVASYIRRWDIITNEVTTISGNVFNTGETINNSFGNSVEYLGLNSIVIDPTDLYINEPCIYAVTITGCVLRILKNNSNLCDERGNWITYIIAGSHNANGLTDGAGDIAEFHTSSDIKQLGVYNNAPILLIADKGGATALRMVYFNGGNRNAASDWIVKTLPSDVEPIGNVVDGIAYSGANYATINVDRTTNEIFTAYANLGTTFIFITKFLGDPNDPNDYMNSTLYSNIYALKSATASGSTLGAGVNGNSAFAENIMFINKIMIGGIPTYVYCEFGGGPGPNTASIYMNGFVKNIPIPVDPSSFTYSQIVDDNTGGSAGNIGAFSSTCYACCTGIFPLNNGNIVDYGPGGFRLWDFIGEEIVSVLVGEVDNTYNQTELALPNGNFTDTQYKFNLEC